MSIAHTQRREKARNSSMAYVEEVIPKEHIHFPLKSLLFIVPDNWHPPSQFPISTSASGIIHHV
jgi:hypothetical protein